MAAQVTGRSSGRRNCLAAVVCWFSLTAPLTALAAPEPVPVDRGALVPPRSRLPFRPLNGAEDHFAVSSLTSDSDRAWMYFSNARGARIDMDALDRHGHFPPGDVPADSTARALYERARREAVANVTPPEKAALTPPQAGVHTGIPGAAAATGAVLGGLALLIKILTLGI